MGLKKRAGKKLTSSAEDEGRTRKAALFPSQVDKLRMESRSLKLLSNVNERRTTTQQETSAMLLLKRDNVEIWRNGQRAGLASSRMDLLDGF